jgi:hypothetical protein
VHQASSQFVTAPIVDCPRCAPIQRGTRFPFSLTPLFMQRLRFGFAVLALAMAGFGCAAVSVQGQDWLTRTTEMDVGVMEHSLSASEIVEVTPERRTVAVTLLEHRPWLAITPKEAAQFSGHERSGLMLVRAVRFTDRPYGIGAYYRGGVLFVLTGGMGAGTVKFEKTAVLVDLQRPINRTYVDYSVDL